MRSETNQGKGVHLFRALAGMTFLLTLLAGYHFWGLTFDLGVVFSLNSRLWLFVLGIGILGLIQLVLFTLTWSGLRGRVGRWLDIERQYSTSIRALGLSLIVLSIGVFIFITWGPFGGHFNGLIPRIWLFWMVVLAVTAGMALLNARWELSFVLAAAALLVGVIHRIAAFIPDISTYPFSLWWSETSRYYYASLFFAERLYGVGIPPSVLHPSRYLIQSLPFLLPELPLWFHRLWQVLVWLLTTFGTAILLERRLKLKNPRISWAFVAWSFLFLFQGPVYYHLLVPVMLVLWGFDKGRILRSTLILLVASIWAGISRLNWYPVPGMLGASLLLMEQPMNSPQSIKAKGLFRGLSHYFRLSFLWVIGGTLVAFGSQILYVIWSGNDPESFTSSFTSDLLWYRLFPSSVYPLGVLTGVFLVSAPLILLIGRAILERRVHSLRWLGLGVMLLVLLVGGLLVSVKIGGGSNLHNLDAYLVLLLVIGSYVYFGRFRPERVSSRESLRSPSWLTVFILLVPILFNVTLGNPRTLPERPQVEKVLASLTEMVKREAQQGEEVLFISQRHLITFDLVSDVHLVPKYETVFFMEMVMAGNQTYLEGFYDDIRDQLFGLIVIDPVPRAYKDRDKPFSEENNIWVRRVSEYLLEHYQLAERFQNVGIEVYEPKP